MCCQEWVEQIKRVLGKEVTAEGWWRSGGGAWVRGCECGNEDIFLECKGFGWF